MTPDREKIDHCPECKTELAFAKGIGFFCPNKNCDVTDNLWDEKYGC